MQNAHSSKIRFHDLDFLRAVLLLAGVVLHVAAAYKHLDFGWVAWEPEKFYFFEMLVRSVHGYRMHAFFLIAGFFSSMLLTKNKNIKFLLTRFKRVLLPFFVSYVLLVPFLKYVWGDDLTLSIGLWFFHDKFAYFHLWFLLYLSFYNFLHPFLSSFYKKLNLKYVGPLGVSFFSAICFIYEPRLEVSEPFTPFPPYSIFINYFCFYSFGAVLYYQKNFFEKFFNKKASLFLVGQLGGFVFLYLNYLEIQKHYELSFYIKFLAYWGLNLYSWSTAIFLIVLFRRYLNKKNQIVGYLVDSSYWVYLVHLPICAYFQRYFFDFNISVYLKFSIVLALTLLLSFLSYQLIGQYSYIGKRKISK